MTDPRANGSPGFPHSVSRSWRSSSATTMGRGSSGRLQFAGALSNHPASARLQFADGFKNKSVSRSPAICRRTWTRSGDHARHPRSSRTKDRMRLRSRTGPDEASANCRGDGEGAPEGRVSAVMEISLAGGHGPSRRRWPSRRRAAPRRPAGDENPRRRGACGSVWRRAAPRAGGRQAGRTGSEPGSGSRPPTPRARGEGR